MGGVGKEIDAKKYMRVTEQRPNSWTKSRQYSAKSFPPCYSQSPLQLCLENSISSNSRNLLQFLHSTGQLLYTVKEKKGTPDRGPYPHSFKAGIATL